MENSDIKKISVFRHTQNEELKYVAKNYTNNSTYILNIGSVSSREYDKEGCRYKRYFKTTNYYTLDVYGKKHEKHHIIQDIEKECQSKIKYDLILIMSFFEHIKNPILALENIEQQFIHKDTLLYVTLPFIYEYHGEKGCKDYWRFTKDCILEMFRHYNIIKYREMESVELNGEDKKNTYSGSCILLKRKYLSID